MRRAGSYTVKKRKNERRFMENNIKVFRVHRALSWLYGLMVLLTIFLLVMLVKDGESVGPFIGVFIFIGLLFSLQFFIAKGARERKGWAKVGSVIIAILMLFAFPVGTIIGIYLLVNNSKWDSVPVQNT
jgi:ABC-type phosphate transport system permease subunit